MRNIIQLLTYSSFAVILFLTGCSNSISEEKLSDCEKELPVSIVASIMSEYDFHHKPASAPSRANDKVEDENDGTWTEKIVEMNEQERAIAHIFLFAYKRGETTPEKVILYYPSGQQPSNIAQTIEQRELKMDGTNVSMDLELFSGFYNFVLIVNSEAALKAAEKGIPNPSTLKEDNKVLSSDDLTGPNRKYLPMIGQSELFVPNHNSGSEDNRVTLIPAIDLERIHARVEFILTTQKRDEDGGGYLSSILPNSRVKKLTLLNEQMRYTVMPSADDYTVTGKGQTSTSKIIEAAPLKNKTPMIHRYSFHIGTEKSSSDNRIDSFKERLLPYDTKTKSSKYIYVAPSTLATSVEDCLAFDFVVAFPHQTTVDEYSHYIIPLYNVDVKDINDKKRYVTRRNTIYRINAKLFGPDLLELDYEVVDWTHQDVDIPW